MPKVPESIAISLIAYNEEEAIGPLIADCITVLEKLTTDYEILVVNDGSTDRTRDIVLDYSKKNEKIHLVDHPMNLGFGPTLCDAFQKPTKSTILFLPGDGQIAPSVLPALLAQLASHDYVLGWRKDRQDQGFRKILSGLYNLFISLLLRKRVHDVDSIVLVKRKVVQPLTLRSTGAFLHAELLLRTARRGFSWVEEPIPHRARQGGVSKAVRMPVLLSVIRDAWTYLLTSASEEPTP
jgi:glycosyltransferase involved in cell wall biosynthesis